MRSLSRAAPFSGFLAVLSVLAIGVFAVSMDTNASQDKIVAGITGMEFNAYIGDDNAVGSGIWVENQAMDLVRGGKMGSVDTLSWRPPNRAVGQNVNPGPSLTGREWGGRSRPDTVMDRFGTNNLYRLEVNAVSAGSRITYPMRA